MDKDCKKDFEISTQHKLLLLCDYSKLRHKKLFIDLLIYFHCKSNAYASCSILRIETLSIETKKTFQNSQVNFAAKKKRT